MGKLTLGEAREEVAEAANLCSTDSRVAKYVNKAVRRLIPKGKWVGTMQRYKICTKNACITWPRAIETIEAYAICGVPGKVRNGWFEFLENGPGIFRGSDCGCGGGCVGNQLVDRGEHPAFDDIEGVNKKIRVYADVAQASGSIILRGYDENGQWIRTLDGGTWIDGEKVTISTTPQLSVKFFSKLVQVIKPTTNGPVRLYEYNNDTAVNTKALAYYEADETLPSYRRSYVPGVAGHSSGSDCEEVSLEVAAKLRFVPVVNDNDFILIGNLPAIVEEVRAVRKLENNLFGEAEAYEQKAVQYLQEELASYIGDGPVVALRVEDRWNFGAGLVEGPVS